MRTHGLCPGCGVERMLPGRVNNADVCVDCAHIEADFHCHTCGIEAEHYRKGTCARCALRNDLNTLLPASPGTSASNSSLIDVLAAAGRPESMIRWLRSAQVESLLSRLGSGELQTSHEAFDDEPPGRHVEHLRSILTHHGLLPQRDYDLWRFERWIANKLQDIAEPHIRRPVDNFARWHHLRRIRQYSAAGKETWAAVHSSKQEITEVIKFLTWLHETHARSLDECVQGDVDAWLATGPTTRRIIRTFFVWAVDKRLCSHIVIGHRKAKTVRILTQEQRLDWLGECLTSTSETLPYRVAAAFLLLYAQPITKIVALQASDVIVTPNEVRLNFGGPAVPLPEPFASLLKELLENRPNLQTNNHGESRWLFPSTRAGKHLHPGPLMTRIRALGIDLLGARNAALRGLVAEVPAPLIADMLGYSYQVTQRHAALAAEPWSRYATRRSEKSR